MTAAELNRLLDLIRSDPSARDELRRAVLSDDLLALPGRMERVERALERLAAAQERTEHRLEALAAAQERTEQQLAALAERVDALAAAQERTEHRLATLAAAQEGTEQRLEALAERVEELAEAQGRTERHLETMVLSLARIDTRTGHLERVAGRAFEVDLPDRVAGVLARVGLDVTPVSRAAITRHFQRRGALGMDLRRLCSQPDWYGVARGSEGTALVLAETSVTAHEDDVKRLMEWREIAGRFGAPAIPVLIARRSSFDFPPEEELRRREITWEISETADGSVAEPVLGDLEL